MPRSVDFPKDSQITHAVIILLQMVATRKGMQGMEANVDCCM